MRRPEKSIQQICAEKECACFASANSRAPMNSVCAGLYMLNLELVYRRIMGVPLFEVDEAEFRKWRISHIETIRKNFRTLVHVRDKTPEWDTLMEEFTGRNFEEI